MEGSPPCVRPTRTGREAMSSLEELTVPERLTVASFLASDLDRNCKMPGKHVLGIVGDLCRERK